MSHLNILVPNPIARIIARHSANCGSGNNVEDMKFPGMNDRLLTSESETDTAVNLDFLDEKLSDAWLGEQLKDICRYYVSKDFLGRRRLRVSRKTNTTAEKGKQSVPPDRKKGAVTKKGRTYLKSVTTANLLDLDPKADDTPDLKKRNRSDDTSSSQAQKCRIRVDGSMDVVKTPTSTAAPS